MVKRRSAEAKTIKEGCVTEMSELYRAFGRRALTWARNVRVEGGVCQPDGLRNRLGLKDARKT